MITNIDWNENNVKHLLSRTLFGYKREDIELALSLDLDTFVDQYLLAESELPNPPGSWVNDTNASTNIAFLYPRYLALFSWQYKLMQFQSTSLREKMVLFFSNHFVTEAEKVEFPQFLYRTNNLFRDNAFGNFKDLTKKITIDAGMLIYLDGKYNTKDVPNENYARELLELFTIGIGNYTEQDIRESTRALTGWQVKDFETVFNENLFDDGEKEFFGQTGNYTYTDIIDIIFQQEETSKFICRKLYREFIHSTPDEDFVNEIAQIFRDNNFEIKPVLSAIFKSEHFYQDKFIGAYIKSPNDLIVGALKEFNFAELTQENYYYLIESSDKMQQLLFDPPDVRGWEKHRKWISTTTLPLRNGFTDSLLTGVDINGTEIGFNVNILEFARSFESSENASQFVDDVTNYMFNYPLSANTKEKLVQILLDGAAEYDWSTYNDQAETRLISFLKSLTRLPEYQLA